MTTIKGGSRSAEKSRKVLMMMKAVKLGWVGAGSGQELEPGRSRLGAGQEQSSSKAGAGAVQEQTRSRAKVRKWWLASTA